MYLVILIILLHSLYFYLEMPVLSWGFTDWSVLPIAWGVGLLLIASKGLARKVKELLSATPTGRLFLRMWEVLGRDNSSAKVVDIGNRKLSGNYRRLAIFGGVLITVGLANLFILPILLSNVFFFNQSYRNLLGTVQESSFTADIEPMKMTQIRIIDEETAIKLASKKIGEIPALGSETRMGKMALQKVRDKLYYVAPLEHRGFFQWVNNHSLGSQGYIMVSAVNPQDVHLVQTNQGRDVRLKYQTNAFLFDYLPRYLYFHGIVDAGLADFTFEVDDDLNPYWVATIYKNKVGFAGSDAIGAVVVNAETGDIKRYGVGEVPAWVDRIQPEEFVYDQITYWGRYINGFWNSLTGKVGMLRPTGERLNLIYGNDDSVYWYTGITSAGRDESTVGFVLVNSRTKDAKWYKVAGATEGAAEKSAEGQVQEKGYKSGYPILYNIYGVPTYIAPLKDKEGLLKLVAFISVENYNLVGVGPDLESALRAYQSVLSSKGNSFIPGYEVKPLKLQGKISRFSQVVKSGESYFYFMLEGDSRIFMGTAATFPRLPLGKIGDTTDITFNDSKDSPISITQYEAGY